MRVWRTRGTAVRARVGGRLSGQLHRARGIVETCATTKHPLVYEQRVDLGAR